MDAGQLERQYFARFKEVTDVGFAIVVAYFTCNAVIDYTKIRFPFFIVNIDNALARKKHGHFVRFGSALHNRTYPHHD
jgi:hypothetical protein